MIDIHKLYLLKKFSKKIILISCIFLVLVMIINLIEEANFLKESNTSFSTPILLTFLNAPSLLYEMFPFIFLISTQFFYIEIYENREIDTLKQFGVDNFSMLRFISFTSFFFGVLIISLFYNFSSTLKNQYLKIKNDFAGDKKYLAVITKNGIWIKDNSSEGSIIINSDKIQNNFLINTSITHFDKNFDIKKNIIAKKIDIKSKNWKLFDVIVTEVENVSKKYDRYSLKSNFDLEKISNLFSDLTSLTYFELLKLEKDYKSIGYSIDEIKIQKHRIYSFPILLCIMTIIASIIMVYNKFKKNLLLNLFIGIFFSVLIYYLGNFSNLLGENGRLPLILSVWFPIVILIFSSIIGIIKINEE
ncbi:LptF/LptG family permease [Pelagibacterales bacterium SAG-MED47]|nr:LptF/LptG family permease [Pelagibacterales bacterium SAG-MED47]